MERITLLENIKCQGCGNSIKNEIAKFEKVQLIDLNIGEGRLVVEGVNQEIDQLLTNLEDMGYPELGKGNLLKTAKSYVSCMIGRMEG
jgi:copper chaperone